MTATRYATLLVLVLVPVDWRDPDGPKFGLAPARRTATDPGARIGSLAWAVAAAVALAAVLQRWDAAFTVVHLHRDLERATGAVLVALGKRVATARKPWKALIVRSTSSRRLHIVRLKAAGGPPALPRRW
ncbi:hypothetical protein ACH4FE_04995 [Streptomyces celluloflavus]|uniref:hypothetical protein n=1 Tax=Streptomyces celluloflavus TaxID=58344 RepID=UPI0037A2F39F